MLIEIGKFNELEILRTTSVGLYLGDEDGEDVLLPNKYCPLEYEIGDILKVFVYRDYEERKIATNIIPFIFLNEFALLECAAVSEFGAFMEWGMEKHLMVPFKEQRQKLEEGRWYIIHMAIDSQTDRLFGTNKIERILQNDDLTVAEGDKVDLLVMQSTDLGFTVIVNHQHKGLIFDNEIFQDLRIGDRLTGYVKKIREDNKLDISLQPLGYVNAIDSNCEVVHQALVDNKGFLPLTDKSSPDDIYNEFGMSKKAFKKALGSLYKQRKVSLGSGGIKLLE